MGITSQREIEKAVREAEAAGQLPAAGSVDAAMTLSVPALGLEHVIEHKFSVGRGGN